MSVFTAKPVFINSLFTVKAVFVNSLFTVKAVMVNSVGLRLFQKNPKLTNFLSIWKMKLYYVRCIKYFSLGILRHNFDFVGPLNFTISCIQVKFWVFIYMDFYTSRAASKILRSIVLWNKLNMTYHFWVLAKKLVQF